MIIPVISRGGGCQSIECYHSMGAGLLLACGYVVYIGIIFYLDDKFNLDTSVTLAGLLLPFAMAGIFLLTL